MKRPKHHTQQTKQAADPSPPPDPVEVLAQHWADLTGWTRTKARDQLVQIGHAALKENRGAINTLRQEMTEAIDAQSEKLKTGIGL